MPQQYSEFSVLALAYPAISIKAGYRLVPEDFQVDEVLPFEPGGGGEHAWLLIRKRDNNTDWVAARLAQFADVKRHAVSYAGLKDRFALTTQWFSVHLPGRDDVDWHTLSIDGVELLSHTRHARKLQRGALKQNRFRLRLAGIEGNMDLLEERCRVIAERGVPNYFGAQRFGYVMQNLKSAERMFTQPKKRLPRHKRSLYLSAARSWMFNEILSQRIMLGNWNRRIEGDVFMLNGSRACFTDDASSELESRLADGEIHPTAVLWGEGELMSASKCARIEMEAIDHYPVFRQGLIDSRVEMQRRAMRLMVPDLEFTPNGSDAILDFTLPAGSYATVVLREMGSITTPDSGLRD